MECYRSMRLLLELVVFYVYMFVSELNFSFYYVLIFDEVKINVGGGYN